jgi:hypothetical protein
MNGFKKQFSFNCFGNEKKFGSYFCYPSFASVLGPILVFVLLLKEFISKSANFSLMFFQRYFLLQMSSQNQIQRIACKRKYFIISLCSCSCQIKTLIQVNFITSLTSVQFWLINSYKKFKVLKSCISYKHITESLT